jgi:cytochrome c oxidase cbb3-type subunit IV
MEFDVNTWRSLITVASLLLFVGLMAWTMNGRRQSAFDEAAGLPFVDDSPAQAGNETLADAQRSNKP